MRPLKPRDFPVTEPTGVAQEGLGDLEKAKQSWQEAARLGPTGGRTRGSGAGSHGLAANRGVQRYYQALAQRKLGQTDPAEAGRGLSADLGEGIAEGAGERNQGPGEGGTEFVG